MPTSEHTPTPWNIQRLINSQYHSHRIEALPYGAIAYIPHSSSPQIDEANLEFIVKACNSYDAMLQALQDADQLLGYFHWDSGEGRTDKFELVQKIRAAIAKAKGESL